MQFVVPAFSRMAVLRKKTHSTEYLIYGKNSSINSPNPLECELDGMLILNMYILND